MASLDSVWTHTLTEQEKALHYSKKIEEQQKYHYKKKREDDQFWQALKNIALHKSMDFQELIAYLQNKREERIQYIKNKDVLSNEEQENIYYRKLEKIEIEQKNDLLKLQEKNPITEMVLSLVAEMQSQKTLVESVDEEFNALKKMYSAEATALEHQLVEGFDAISADESFNLTEGATNFLQQLCNAPNEKPFIEEKSKEIEDTMREQIKHRMTPKKIFETIPGVEQVYLENYKAPIENKKTVAIENAVTNRQMLAAQLSLYSKAHTLYDQLVENDIPPMKGQQKMSKNQFGIEFANSGCQDFLEGYREKLQTLYEESTFFKIEDQFARLTTVREELVENMQEMLDVLKQIADEAVEVVKNKAEDLCASVIEVSSFTLGK